MKLMEWETMFWGTSIPLHQHLEHKPQILQTCNYQKCIMMRMSRHDLWNSEEDFPPLCDMACNLKPVLKSSPHDSGCSKEVFNHATQLF